MIYLHILAIVIGLFLIGEGMWTAFKMERPWDIVGAVFMPIGLIMALWGTLLICVPHFFSG